MTIKFILNCILILCSVGMQGQYVYFNNLYSTDHPETTNALEVADDGYVTVSGQNLDGDYRVLLRKYSFEGVTSIEASYSVDADYFFSGPQAALKRLTNEQGFLYCTSVGGSSNVFGRVYRIAENLDTLWTTNLDLFPGDDTELMISQEMEDGYLYFGFVQYEIDRDILCVKLNLDGEYQWHWVLEDATDSNTPQVAKKIDDDQYFVGGTKVNGNLSGGWIKSIYLDGNELWSHNLGDPDMTDAYIQSIISLPNGHYQTAYGHAVSGLPELPFHQWRTIEFGNDASYQEYNQESYDTFWLSGVSKQLLVGTSNVVMAGTYFDGDNSILGIIMTTDISGQVEWMHTYAYQTCESCNNVLSDMEFAPDSGYICTGYFIDYSEDIPINKTWLLKIDACGDVQYNGCPPSVNVHEETQNNSGISLWPNPARETLHLNADPGIEITSLRLFDLTEALVIENHLRHFTGSYSVDVSSLPGGYYFAEITDGKGNRQVFKLVME